MVNIAAIAASSSGANQIVAGVANKRIYVLGWVLSFGGTVNAKWQDGTTDKTGLFYGAATVVAASAPCTDQMGKSQAQFITTAGADLNLNLSTNVAVGGYVLYEQF